MCLFVSETETVKLYNKLRKQAYITCYKVLVKRYNTYFSPTFCKYWQLGVNVADGGKKYTPGVYLPYAIHNGIHVYLSRRAAREEWIAGRDNLVRSDHKIIKVICRVEDFVAADIDQAVFRKVTVASFDHVR
jgi:hypothetical protein